MSTFQVVDSATTGVLIFCFCFPHGSCGALCCSWYHHPAIETHVSINVSGSCDNILAVYACVSIVDAFLCAACSLCLAACFIEHN